MKLGRYITTALAILAVKAFGDMGQTESEAGDSKHTRTVATAVEGISTEHTGTDVEVVVRWTATTAATASTATTKAPRLE